MISNNLMCIFLVLAASILIQKGEVVIDRTDLRTQTYKGPLGMSGVGSSSRGSLDAVFEFPIQLNEASAQISPDGNFIATMKITNIGDSMLKIPTSLDQVKVHRAGALNRTEFAVSVDVTSDEKPPSPEKREAVEVLFGSDSFPDSLVSLAPGGSVTFRVGLPSKALGVHVGDHLYLFAETLRLSNEKYFIESRSNVIPTIKAIVVTGPQ
jgi:hypothetical protein